MVINKGNFFSLNGIPVVVIEEAKSLPSGGDLEEALVTVRRKWGGTFRVPASDLHPIVITPYYLIVSLHFQPVGEHQLILKKNTSKYQCTMVWTHLNTWCLILNGGEVVEDITYIHELQIVLATKSHIKS